MNLTRRRLLTGSAGLIVAGVLSQTLSGRYALASPPLASAVAPSAGFNTLSVLITGQDKPDALLAQRLYSWLAAHTSGLDSQLETLSSLLQQHSDANGSTLLSLMKSQPENINTLYQSLVSGWYLGVVGPLPRPDCITFENIVSYQLLKQSVLPPSYAPGQPGFWVQPPAGRVHV